jgi:DNA invertase Pin-like site-specific DNA recombinase
MTESEGPVLAALYARVSTRDGRQSNENQLEGMREYARRRGWTIAREYIDCGTGSAGVSGRDEFAALLADAYERMFDVVLVWALDRFTREGVLQAFQYISSFKSWGVEFHSLTEPHFQTSGPAGELFLAVAAWMAKQERARLRERIKAGLDRARARGKILGRPRVGLDLSKLERLRERGLSVRAAAFAMGTSRSTIERGLRVIAAGQKERA